MVTKPAYAELVARHARLYRYEHLSAMLHWDRAAIMPAKGSAARAAAQAELHALIHGLRSDSQVGALIVRAEDEPLDDFERANLREMRREWRAAATLPSALVEARTLAGARCEHAWRNQRPANDWAGFLTNFREVVRLAREEARLLGEALQLSPYDALVDRFEPGITSAEIDRLFGGLQQWLPTLAAQVVEKQRGISVLEPSGPFPIAAQKVMSQAVMKRLGFDFAAGRLDESTHPFTGGVPEDVRLTTRYREDDLIPALRSTIHETGHARYAQNLPRAWLGQPVGTARSYGIHESQSLFFEMQLGRSRPFVGLLAPMLFAHFGDQPAFDADNLFRLLTRVAPGHLRVSADELTYPLHIVLRYEIERALIGGEVEPDDIPALWDEGMQRFFGIDTRGNYRDGCLQDIHWSGGAFGYFPSYTLGALYAAQWYAALRSDEPHIEASISAGELGAVFQWLDQHIWSAASRWETRELVHRASGGPLDPAHFRAHLERRYLGH